jgi:hypothetical protein
MSFLKRGFKGSVKAIKDHKLLFLSIIVLQIILISMLSYVSFNYQLKIIEGAQEVIEPLNNANYDQESLQAGQPFTKDIVQIYTGYKTMMKNIVEYILWLSGIFLLINGAIWLLIYRMFEKKNWLKQAVKYVTSSLIFMVPFFTICYFILKGFLSIDIAPEAFASVIQVMSIVFLVIYYFLLIGFSQLHVKRWKNFVKSYYKIGIKKILYPLTVLVINWSFIFLAGWFIYLTAMNEVHLIIMFLALMFLVIVLTLSKIFWIASLNSIEK